MNDAGYLIQDTGFLLCTVNRIFKILHNKEYLFIKKQPVN